MPAKMLREVLGRGRGCRGVWGRGCREGVQGGGAGGEGMCPLVHSLYPETAARAVAEQSPGAPELGA